MKTRIVDYLETEFPTYPLNVIATISDRIEEAITAKLVGGDTLLLPVGELSVWMAAPRKGRNPKRPEVTIDIPAKRRLRFVPNPEMIPVLNPPTPTP